MNCPVCSKPLVAGINHRYEILTEHVFCEDEPLPEKPTLICENPLCLTFGRGFWATPDYEGCFYSIEKDGIVVCNVPDLECPITEMPHIRLGYNLKMAGELLGELPLWQKVTFERVRRHLAPLICQKCGGKGVLDELNDYELRDCPECKGSGIC